MTTVWAGIDSGKRAHHCVVIDATGSVLLSRRLDNDEAALLGLIAAVLALANGDEVVWATDLNDGGADLVIALLAGYQTPDAIRCLGEARLAAWLKARGARGSQELAIKAVAVANAQHTVLVTQTVAAQLVARLAAQIQAIYADVAALDE